MFFKSEIDISDPPSWSTQTLAESHAAVGEVFHGFPPWWECNLLLYFSTLVRVLFPPWSEFFFHPGQRAIYCLSKISPTSQSGRFSLPLISEPHTIVVFVLTWLACHHGHPLAKLQLRPAHKNNYSSSTSSTCSSCSITLFSFSPDVDRALMPESFRITNVENQVFQDVHLTHWLDQDHRRCRDIWHWSSIEPNWSESLKNLKKKLANSEVTVSDRLYKDIHEIYFDMVQLVVDSEFSSCSEPAAQWWRLQWSHWRPSRPLFFGNGHHSTSSKITTAILFWGLPCEDTIADHFPSNWILTC